MKEKVCNPLEIVIEKLKEKEIYTNKGANTPSLVFLSDAIEALQELEVLVLTCCEAEMVKKHILNQEDY